MPDGRVLSVLDVNSEWRGDLVAVDPADLQERIIDRDVVMFSPEVEGDDTILYGVSDDERTGVWLARLAD
jgi:hypothetical protein